MLSLDKVCVSFRTEKKDSIFGFGRTPVLKDISLKLEQGSCLGILGESGSGDNDIMMIVQ